MKKKQDSSASKTKKTIDKKQNEESNLTDDSSKAVGKNDDSFPGYPHYPPKDDIFNSGMEEIGLDDVQPLAPNLKEVIPASAHAKKKSVIEEEEEADEEEQFGELEDSDVTKSEIKLLDDSELVNDGGEDAQLKNRPHPVDVGDDDLDVPGAELDDEDELIGEEDEENNYYSLGGDRHEDLEEDKDLGQ